MENIQGLCAFRDRVKTCSKCKEDKTYDLFKKRGGDKLSSWCKKCNSIQSCEYQKNNSKKLLKNKLKYKKTEKGLEANKRYKNGESGLKAKVRYNHSDFGHSAQARWRANRRSHDKKVINDLTRDEWDKILKHQNNKCNICKNDFDKSHIKKRPERDHIIPLSKGGSLTYSNVQALCRSCNAKKSNKIGSFELV